jgi:hypothetical protein
MTRIAGVLVVVLGLMVVPALAQGTGSAAQGSKAPAAKTVRAMGTVSAVTTNSLTVKGQKAEWTFSIDKETVVVVKGATRKNMELKAEGKSAKLTDFVKVGDEVTVTYYDGTPKLATDIRVTTPAK